MIYALLAAVIAVQLADAYTTHWIISRGGVELNPFVAKPIQWLGLLPALVIIKGVIGCGLPIVLVAAGDHYWYGLPFLLVISLVPLPGNVEAMKRMRQRHAETGKWV